MVLSHSRALALAGVQDRGPDDLDDTPTGAMAGSHLRVHLVHSTVQGRVTVFTVHVVSSGTAIVPQPHSVVLHVVRVLLEDLFDFSSNYYSGKRERTQSIRKGRRRDVLQPTTATEDGRWDCGTGEGGRKEDRPR